MNYALGALYYMCDYNREEIVRAEVVDLIKRYAAAESVSVSFSNLAKAFLDKHVNANTWDSWIFGSIELDIPKMVFSLLPVFV